MRTFWYWISECQYDHQCYSIIGRTKKEVVEKLSHFDDPSGFGPVEQRRVQYEDLFDFFDWVTSEGGGRNCGLRN